MDLTGKKIVITGASSGIGLDVVKLLLNYDVQILAVGRNMEMIPQDKKVFPLQCDIASEEGVDKVFEEAAEKLGGIDLFWANAGYGYYEKFGTPDWNHIQSIFNTNVLSPYYSLQKLLAFSPGKKVSFLVTDSIVGQLEMPGYVLYVASKFAINGGMRSAQYEMPENVTISIIYPIATATKFFDRAGSSLKKAGPVQSSESCAHAIIKGIQHDKKHIYPYRVWSLLNYILTVFPFLKTVLLKLKSKEMNRFLGN
jgi:uncharacterized protein